MSLYGEIKIRVFSTALSVSEITSGLQELEDSVQYLQSKIASKLKQMGILNKQLEDLFQHIRDNFTDEEVAMIGKEDETKTTEV